MQSESRYNYLNDVNYFFKYSEDVVSTITNVIIPYVTQFEYYSDENHFNRIIQILLEADQSYEDIYYSLGVYLLSQAEEVEEKMNTVRTILFNLQRADETVAQRVLQIMNVLIPPMAAAVAGPLDPLPVLQDVKLIVSDEELEKLQVVIFSELQTDEKSCSICLDEFVPESQLYTIPCKHLFHTSCLKDWVAENYKCPVCRGDIAEHHADLGDDAEDGIFVHDEVHVGEDDNVIVVYNVDNDIYNFDDIIIHEPEDNNVHNDYEEIERENCFVDQSHGLAIYFCQRCNVHLCAVCDEETHMYALMRYHERERLQEPVEEVEANVEANVEEDNVEANVEEDNVEEENEESKDD